ncbi:MAG TPA: nucleotidyltransferase family protein [Pyrinomonadaceae bacterium]|nr:nucleotidyltransferase family protein [Pyrinomonadaceae bacterium]
MSEPSIGIIILAAGASSRMGEPKQLLPFRGESLLRRAVRAALETECHPLVVVLGANAHLLQEEIASTGAHIFVNHSWTEGMGSSIRCGLQRALEAESHDEIEAAVFMLCDQPCVTSGVIRRLVDAYRASEALLVASEYEAEGEKTVGVPALFSRALFPELMALRGAQGARRIIASHRQEATVIAVPEAAFDVDTLDDYRALLNMSVVRILP